MLHYEKKSNEEYQNLIIRWQESGISKAEFASREDLSRNAFYYIKLKIVSPDSNPSISIKTNPKISGTLIKGLPKNEKVLAILLIKWLISNIYVRYD